MRSQSNTPDASGSHSSQAIKPILSILCCGNSDTQSAAWRLSTTLNSLARNLEILGVQEDVELLVADGGNSFEHSQLIELSPAARQYSKFLKIPSEIAHQYQSGDSPQGHARECNALARRALGTFVLYLDPGVFIPLDSMGTLIHHVRCGDLNSYSMEDTFFWGSAYRLSKEFGASNPNIHAIDQHIWSNLSTLPQSKINLLNFSGPAIALLMKRALWIHSTGLRESYSDQSTLHAEWHRRLVTNYRCADLSCPGVKLFHFEPSSPSITQRGNSHTQSRSESYGMAANPANWGLADTTLSFSDGYGLNVSTDALHSDAHRNANFDLDSVPTSVSNIVTSNPIYRGIPERFNLNDPKSFSSAQVIDTILVQIKPRYILEIGTMLGTSARHFARSPHVERVFCVDHWDGNRINSCQSKGLSQHQLNNLYEQFLANCAHSDIAAKVFPIRLNSSAAANYCTRHGIKFDLIYISSENSNQGVRCDMDSWLPLLAPYGLLCGDGWNDSAEAHGISATVQAVARGRRLEAVNQGNFWFVLPEDLMTTKSVPVPSQQPQAFVSAPINTPTPLQPSALDEIIPPEVKNDGLYNLIEKLASEEKIKHVLEIGSSSGAGSTEAFVNGLGRNPNRPTLYCMEVSKNRFSELQRRYAQNGFVKCYNVSSIGIESFPTAAEVGAFYNSERTALNNYPLDQVLGWLHQDIDYVKSAGLSGNGIEFIKDQNSLLTFDMVLIDGSEFSGNVELTHVYGARYILLDDVNGFKNFQSRKRLLADPNYILIAEDLGLRSGYSAFKRVDQPLPVHLFTIVLNGEPFIRHHIEAFEKLTIPWHWHIVEGVADLVKDTAWSVPLGGVVSNELHRNGLSNDGTTEYLDQLVARYPTNVSLYRKPPGQTWSGKVEMCNAPLKNISGPCLLWQVDSDELWTHDQVERMRQLFIDNPEKTGAYTHCHYFVGPRKYVSDINSWATRPLDWPRVWRFIPGMTWTSHEPATLTDSGGRDVLKINPISRDQTLPHQLSFQHFSYATEKQVRFKEIYYGYKDGVSQWKELQKVSGKANPKQFLPWAHYDATVEEWPAAYGPTLGDRFFQKQTRIKIAGQDTNGSKDLTQVDGESEFARAIMALFRKIRPQKVIETGTYLGTGTTKIIAKTLVELGLNDAVFLSLEVNPNNIAQAYHNLLHTGLLPMVKLVHGLSLPKSMLPTVEYIESTFVKNIQADDEIYIDHAEHERALLYYKETNFDGVPDDMLARCMEAIGNRPDFVLLDSGGHIGNIEFNHLLSLLKYPCYIALDDIFHIKHHRSFKQISSDSRFQILAESKEKFGFCISHFDPLATTPKVASNEIIDFFSAQKKNSYGFAQTR